MSDPERDRTHWHGCYTDHLECAVREVERLRDLYGGANKRGSAATKLWRRARARRKELQEEVERLREALGDCEAAIASVGKDVFGRDEEHGYPYRDELLENARRALERVENTKGGGG